VVVQPESESVQAQAHVHYLRPNTETPKIEFVRDESSFVCVIMLTEVPEDGTACSFLRRRDGCIETLSFPAGSIGHAFLLHGSQIDHSILPIVDHEATVLSVPIYPADGWVPDEELCSTQETEIGDISCFPEVPDLPIFHADPHPLISISEKASTWVRAPFLLVLFLCFHNSIQTRTR
jgi:hypothetical protein